ncbi:MAG: Ppx/GppA phosphatase family protein [Rickettsiales bacterium]
MLETTTAAPKRSARNKGASEKPVFAALDLGTNNCRLLIASLHGLPRIDTSIGDSPVQVFDSFSRIIRLGEGVSKSGNISEEAIDRAVSALKACRKKLNRYDLTSSRFVATEACRRAKNRALFLERVLNETGIKIDIISTEDEAKLAFSGCASLLNKKYEKALVFDIGGGSTELMWVDVKNGKIIDDWLSVNFGVMNLSDKFGGSDFADITFKDMVKTISDKLQEFDKKNNISEAIRNGGVQMLSTSGTVTTLAAVHLDLPRYDRSRIDGTTLSVYDIRRATEKLLDMKSSERFNHPCIGFDRADFILSGCAIFEAISDLWSIDNITIADRGVREGIILSLAREWQTANG